MLAIDTNVIVRLLTNDDPDQAAKAKGLIANAASLDDEVNRLRRERRVLQIAPAVDGAKHRAFLNPGLGNPCIERLDRRPDQHHAHLLVG